MKIDCFWNFEISFGLLTVMKNSPCPLTLTRAFGEWTLCVTWAVIIWQRCFELENLFCTRCYLNYIVSYFFFDRPFELGWIFWLIPWGNRIERSNSLSTTNCKKRMCFSKNWKWDKWPLTYINLFIYCVQRSSKDCLPSFYLHWPAFLKLQRFFALLRDWVYRRSKDDCRILSMLGLLLPCSEGICDHQLGRCLVSIDVD